MSTDSLSIAASASVSLVVPTSSDVEALGLTQNDVVHALVIGDADSSNTVAIVGTPAELVDLVERIADFVRPMLDPSQYACSIEAHQS
jgi:hypothetical protein